MVSWFYLPMVIVIFPLAVNLGLKYLIFYRYMEALRVNEKKESGES